MKPAILLAILSTVALADAVVQTQSAAQTGDPDIYKGLIVGVGPGVFAVIVTAIFAIVMCLFKDSIEAPNVCVAAAIILPLIVLGIVQALPIKSLSTST